MMYGETMDDYEFMMQYENEPEDVDDDGTSHCPDCGRPLKYSHTDYGYEFEHCDCGFVAY